MIAQETKEQRKERLESARLEYRARINNWVDRVEDVAEELDEVTHKGFADDAFACKVAAELMRQASIAQVKRAVTAVRKARKERGQ